MRAAIVVKSCGISLVSGRKGKKAKTKRDMENRINRKLKLRDKRREEQRLLQAVTVKVF